MRINTISLTDFRNFTSLKTELHPGVNIFYGRNGSGKTNLLEALFVLCLGRSQRGAPDVLLVRNGCDVYRLEGAVESEGRSQTLAVAYQRHTRKKITIDSVAVRIAELYEQFLVVSAGPEDSAILSGPPSVRRAFVDIYLSQLSGKYLADLVDYQKVLAQKNAALKQEMDPTPFEPLLISYGSKIIRRRKEFIEDLHHRAAEHYTAISNGELLYFKYEPSVTLPDDSDTVELIESAYRHKLERMFDRERAVGSSLVGPHRDEVTFEINNFPARTHGSQGQWRTAAISLKLAIYDLLRQRRGRSPILLLDEIFAELDNQRTEGLIEAFKGFSQLFLTTALEPPEALRAESRSFRIQNGMIEDIA